MSGHGSKLRGLLTKWGPLEFGELFIKENEEAYLEKHPLYQASGVHICNVRLEVEASKLALIILSCLKLMHTFFNYILILTFK